MEEQVFEPGDVVQLRSGGPRLTVSSAGMYSISVIYYNDETGLFEKFDSPPACFKDAMNSPEVPEGANRLRSTSVAKSSLS
jgi:uncharacterized protein YodC (DUF2158 family)